MIKVNATVQYALFHYVQFAMTITMITSSGSTTGNIYYVSWPTASGNIRYGSSFHVEQYRKITLAKIRKCNASVKCSDALLPTTPPLPHLLFYVVKPGDRECSLPWRKPSKDRGRKPVYHSWRKIISTCSLGTAGIDRCIKSFMPFGKLVAGDLMSQQYIVKVLNLQIAFTRRVAEPKAAN